jgi:hypothetical protein
MWFKYLGKLPIEIAKMIHMFAFKPVVEEIRQFAIEIKRALCWKCKDYTQLINPVIVTHSAETTDIYKLPVQTATLPCEYILGNCRYHDVAVSTIRRKNINRASASVRNLRKLKKQKLE